MAAKGLLWVGKSGVMGSDTFIPIVESELAVEIDTAN
jgi:hypothetical protein